MPMTLSCPRPISETMEERILHSADLLASSLLAGSGWSSAEQQLQSADLQPQALAQVQRHELVFVDPTLPDLDTLLAGLGPGGAGREIVWLAPDSDGVAVISATLAQRQGVDAVHLLTHGSDGQVRLGSATLDSARLLQRASEIAGWSSALTADADLLIYGCDVAASAAGRQLVRDLAALTGADVAASADPTGATARGGNWILEARTGIIEAAMVPGAATQLHWQGLLNTFTTDPTKADGAVGSLRWAIGQANLNPGADTIILRAGTYTLTIPGADENLNVTGDLDVRGDLTITGAGAATTVISGGGTMAVLQIVLGTSTVSDLTIRDGKTGASGAGIMVDAGARLNLSRAVVSNNVSGSGGGGLYGASGATMVLDHVDILSNSADYGGGIYAYQTTLTISDSSLDGNSTANWGGGVYNDRGAATLARVTVSNNTAGKDGAGIYNSGSGASLDLSNSTISGNTAVGLAGALFNNRSATITSSTIAFNTAGTTGGLHTQSPGTLSLRNSIVAANAGGNSNQAITSLGHNIDSGNALGLTQSGDLANTDPRLAVLAVNGGSARTHALLTGSPAINVADVAAPATDQRGATRVGVADIGAYEFNAAPNTAPSFAVGDGSVRTAIGTSDEEVWGVVTQSDGKILASGPTWNGINWDFGLARYNTNGSLDATFGTGGKVSTAFGTSDDRGGTIAVQVDGKIVVAGYMWNGANYDFALARYSTSGSLDTTFGSGGKVTTVIGTGNDQAYAVAVQADGKIVVAGNSDNGSNIDLAVVRYNASGSLDATFGTGGKVSTGVGSGNDFGNAMALQSDGKIVVAGQSRIGATDDLALVRYNANGSLDASFGTAGKVTTAVGAGNEHGSAVALQSDGKIVLAGWSSNGANDDFAVVRYNAGGSLDAGFGSGGKVSTAVGAGADDAYAVAIQADGKIVLAGVSNNGSNDDFAVVRYSAAGALDTSFDGDGKLTTAVVAAGDGAYALAVQGDGRLLAAGWSHNGANFDYSLVRYAPDGRLDRGFDSAVNTLDAAPAYTKNGAAVVLDGNVQVFDSQLDLADNYGDATLTLSRSGAANTQDLFSASGGLGPLTEGGGLVVSGITVGTVTTNSNGTLRLRFDSNATQARVSQVLQLISYANSSDAPPASVPIRWVFDDGNSGAQGSGGALSATGSTTVAITAVNDPPVITSNGGGASASVSIMETLTAVTSVSATDPDSAALTYSIAGGADAAKFTIIAGTGALTFIIPPDFEAPMDVGANNVYDVTVRVSDGALTDTQAIAVTVIDVGGPLTVSTAADTIDGTVISVEALLANPGTDGLISLREAITAANNTPELDQIRFGIGGGGPQTIALTSGLPSVSSAVVIDGTTQPGYAGAPLIELNGSLAGGSASGLSITAGNSTVRGLVINRFDDSGISLKTAGGNVIQGNYIGTNAAGSAASANAKDGIYVETAGNQIGGPGAGNVISGNGGNAGIELSGNAALGNVIQGNIIGLNAAGSAVVPNTGDGIKIRGGAGSATIGGTAAGTGNVISGNNSSGKAGIFIDLGSGNTIQGNKIGTDTSGSVARPNGWSGIYLDGGTDNNTIGGTAAGAGNVIAYAGSSGVIVKSDSSSGNALLGNSIYGNTSLGIDLLEDGVTLNDGLKRADRANAGMDATKAEAVSFAGADLRNTKIFGRFNYANLAGADLSGANLAPFSSTGFIEHLWRTDLAGADLSGANLQGANLGYVKFRFANLRGANLANTNLRNADLAHADLTGADLSGADIAAADLDRAILTGAKGLDTLAGRAGAANMDKVIQ